ncbi:hypothetical protein [Paenibacillus amylolyticus]|uniref:hypothetical protein n=1 Tax=Paenibacillus amylolyticus TaxID=1451 RepID=UPI003EBFCB22
MRKLEVFGETFEAERIVKTADSIIGYNGDMEVFAFRWVSDFSAFEIDGDYDEPTPDISDEVDGLKRKLTTAEAETAALNLAVIDLWETIANGGAA